MSLKYDPMATRCAAALSRRSEWDAIPTRERKIRAWGHYYLSGPRALPVVVPGLELFPVVVTRALSRCCYNRCTDRFSLHSTFTPPTDWNHATYTAPNRLESLNIHPSHQIGVKQHTRLKQIGMGAVFILALTGCFPGPLSSYLEHNKTVMTGSKTVMTGNKTVMTGIRSWRWPFSGEGHFGVAFSLGSTYTPAIARLNTHA